MKFSDRPEIEIIHDRTLPDTFKQALDEWAELVYHYLCQLPPEQNQIEASPGLTADSIGEMKKETADVA